MEEILGTIIAIPIALIILIIMFFPLILAVGVPISDAIERKKRGKEQKAEQLRREAERKRAEEEQKRKEEEEKRVREEARRAEEAQAKAQQAVFKNSKYVQEIVQEMSKFFIQGIQDAKRDVSVNEIHVCGYFEVYEDHLGYSIAGVRKIIYFQSYGLRNLNPGDNEILNMDEVIKDLLIPKIRNAMPFDKDIGAKVISEYDRYGMSYCRLDVTYTATNGNFSHNDW